MLRNCQQASFSAWQHCALMLANQMQHQCTVHSSPTARSCFTLGRCCAVCIVSLLHAYVLSFKWLHLACTQPCKQQCWLCFPIIRFLSFTSAVFYLPLPLCPATPDFEGCFVLTSCFMVPILQRWAWCLVGGSHCCRYTNKGRAFNPHAPTIGDSLNTAFISAVYASIPSPQIGTALQFRLNCWSRSQVRYVLGDAGRSLVSGWGKKAPTHVQVIHCSSQAAEPSSCTDASLIAIFMLHSAELYLDCRSSPGLYVPLSSVHSECCEVLTLHVSAGQGSSLP